MTATTREAPLAMTAHSLAVNESSEAEMVEWKRLVKLARRDRRSLHLRYDGSANQITGYRLFYMLHYAKQAGVESVTLRTNGLFWNDDATDWLAECGVDQVVLEAAGELSPTLAARVQALAARGDQQPSVIVRPPAD